MEEKTIEEMERLDHYQSVCIEALNQFSESHPRQLLEFEKQNILTLLGRMFAAEKEYLVGNPKDYFVLYDNQAN